jgi:hypothetical protein
VAPKPTERGEAPVTRTRTVLLGQFEDDNAVRIVERLHDADIEHWVKRSGGLARVLFAGDWGTRIFVDEGPLDDAQDIAREILEG